METSRNDGILQAQSESIIQMRCRVFLSFVSWKLQQKQSKNTIDHFTVVSLVCQLMSESEVDLVLIQTSGTSFLFLRKLCFKNTIQHKKNLIYIRMQEGLYPNKVNSFPVSTCNCKMGYFFTGTSTMHMTICVIPERSPCPLIFLNKKKNNNNKAKQFATLK